MNLGIFFFMSVLLLVGFAVSSQLTYGERGVRSMGNFCFLVVLSWLQIQQYRVWLQVSISGFMHVDIFSQWTHWFQLFNKWHRLRKETKKLMSPFFSSDRSAQSSPGILHQALCFTCGFKKAVIWLQACGSEGTTSFCRFWVVNITQLMLSMNIS